MVDLLLGVFKSDVYGESLGFGEACIYALIGYLIVFLGIILIILIIWLIGLLMRKTNNLAFLTKRGKKNKQAVPTAPSAEIVPADKEEEISDEVKVAIVAAIMAYYSAEKPDCEFKVRRIKRI